MDIMHGYTVNPDSVTSVDTELEGLGKIKREEISSVLMSIKAITFLNEGPWCAEGVKAVLQYLNDIIVPIPIVAKLSGDGDGLIDERSAMTGLSFIERKDLERVVK